MPQPNPESIVRNPVDLTRPTTRPRRLRWTHPHRGSRRPSHLFESSITQTGPLAQRDAFLQKIVETCASRVAVLDETGKILFVSESWYSSGQRDRTADGQYPWPLTWFKREGPDPISPDAVLVLSEDIGEILNGTLSDFHREYYCHDKGGKRWFGVHAARLDLPEADRFRLLLSLEERTKEREAEERLRDLSGRLISAQEEERRRIALELHDDLNQRLALLSVELDQISQRIPEVQTDVRISIQNVRARAHEISSAIQKVAYQLHPSMLDQLGLSDAVRRLCEEMARHHEIRITFRDRGCPSCPSKEVALCLYRIVQESLRNVIKHSGSQDAAVVLSATGAIVHLSISDVGKGFDLHSAKAKSGLGLIGMTERLRSVGGEISILSNERGTKIRVSIATSGEKPKTERCESVAKLSQGRRRVPGLKAQVCQAQVA
jgi:signal transduction histidine kinase